MILDIAETSVIWLSKTLNINPFLTDDLEAREVAAKLGIRPVGSIGIIVRCFRKKIINKRKTIDLLNKLQKESSLFITPELANRVIRDIENIKN